MSCLNYDKNTQQCKRCVGEEVQTCSELRNEYVSTCDNIKDIHISDIKIGDISTLIEKIKEFNEMEERVLNCVSQRNFHTNYCIDEKCRDKGHKDIIVY